MPFSGSRHGFSSGEEGNAAEGGGGAAAGSAGPAQGAGLQGPARTVVARVTRAVRQTATATAAFTLGACAVIDFAPEVPGVFQVRGIDVSYFQGDVDWPAVARAGTSFAWIKATEGGDHFDPKFGDNFAAAAEAGIARGAYHFYYFCRPVADQVTWFIQNVPKDPNALPPALDMEWNPQSPTCRKRPPREEVLADMRTWLDAIEAYYGKRPVIYTTVDFHRDRLEGAFQDYHIWVRSVAGHPSMKYGERKWHFWQHTSTGSVAGVPGKVDENVFYGSPDQWKAFVAGKLDPNA